MRLKVQQVRELAQQLEAAPMAGVGVALDVVLLRDLVADHVDALTVIGLGDVPTPLDPLDAALGQAVMPSVCDNTVATLLVAREVRELRRAIDSARSAVGGKEARHYRCQGCRGLLFEEATTFHRGNRCHFDNAGDGKTLVFCGFVDRVRGS